MCVCAVLFYAELVFKLKSDTIHTHTTSTLLRVRLSAGMSLCSFFYIIFFPCNSSEDIPLSVQRAASYEPNDVRAAVCALFFAVDRRPRLTHDAPPFDVLRSRQRRVGVSKGDYGRTECYIFVRSTVVEVKHLSKLNRSKNRDLCRATEYNNNNISPRTGARVSSSKDVGRSGPASDISITLL